MPAARVPWPVRLYGAFAPLLARTVIQRTRRRLAGAGTPEARLAEILGVAHQPRPEGPVLWFHAASVGESLSALPLIERLRDRHFILLTSGTATSARVMQDRLPEGCLHQFAPIDTPRAVRTFLDHWRPDAAVFMESEIWPNKLRACAARGIPLALVNARLSGASLKHWSRAPATARYLFDLFRFITAQDQPTRAGLEQIAGLAPGSLPVGNLKAAISPPDADAAALADWQDRIAGRPVWIASSTHPGEDAPVLEAHAGILRDAPRALCILAPRHPERGAEILALARSAGFAARLRSAGELPGDETQVYIADTVGETGLWYRLSPLVFLAGSWSEAGGHNPWEPAALDAALLHGPKVRNARADYALLDAAGAARAVNDATDLSAAVSALLSDHVAREAMQAAARAQSGRAGDLADDVAARIERLADGGEHAT